MGLFVQKHSGHVGSWVHRADAEVPHPGRPNVSKEELKSKIKDMYKANDELSVVLFGFRTKFGGGRSTGFCLIYDNASAAKKNEPKYRMIRAGEGAAGTTSREQRKERKNRMKKAVGTDKTKVLKGQPIKKRKRAEKETYSTCM